MVILRTGLDHEDLEDEGVDDEVESDSDSGLGGSVPPCSVTFIGANVSTGKSSMRSKSRDKKVNISRREAARLSVLQEAYIHHKFYHL